MWMTILGTALVALWAIYHRLPIGRLHGQQIYPKDLLHRSVRLGLRLSSARKSLAACMKLPARERLPKLLELERRHGDDFMAGEEVLVAVVGTGLDDAIPHLQRIMNQSWKGPGNVMLGLKGAILSGTMEDGYRIHAIKLLIDGLQDQSLFDVFASHIPELLIQLDKEWAARLLTEIGEREPEHFLYATVLETLRTHDLPFDPGVLETTLSENHESSKSDPRKRIAAAKILHHTKPDQAVAILEELMESQSHVAELAADALLELKDLPHPRHLLDDLQRHLGFDTLSEAEKIVWHADQCGYFLGMDYLYRFEAEKEGDQLCEMLEALIQVGAEKAAAKLKAYMDLYGPEGPPRNVLERSRIASSQGEAWNQSIMSLNELHDSYENITLLAIQYELRHSGQFHKASEIRKILNRPDKPSELNR